MPRDGVSLTALERKLAIDQRDLEGERRSQHDKFYLVSKELALAISRRDAAKKDVKETEARLAEEMRRGWDQERNGRLTDTACAAKVLLHPDMIEASDDLLDAELQASLWWALKDAFEQRNDALKDLIRLYLSEHYGEQQLRQAENGRMETPMQLRLRRERRDRDRSR